ncbi:hypothetical protein F4777DRAFT_548558 [Nemania sp. FL0916]|nr:hypothetical protein F4777DRAFT_548558 [Nemania sp. FL0916]
MCRIMPVDLPHYYNIPGRQDAIDHAGKIDKEQFVVSSAVLFGIAMLSVVTRLVVRILGRVPWRLDDGLVILAAALLASGYATCLHNLDSLYLIEALNKGVVFLFQEELPKILSIQKWSTISAFLIWTSVYLVKFTFLYFFHTLVQGMPRKITTFFWSTVCLTVVFWIYTVLDPIIICPHFGADAIKCSAFPNRHARSLAGNLLVAIIDIICDAMIVTIPIIVLKRSLMPTARKVSLAAMLCLSIVMVVIAFIRLIGSIVDTRPDGNGTAPAWSTYWSLIEGCVSLTMTSVIVIRAVFITKAIGESKRMHDNLWTRTGRRLLSTLRLSGSFRGSRQSSPHASDKSPKNDLNLPSPALKWLARNTRSSTGLNRSDNEGYKGLDDAAKDGDMNYKLRDLEK